MTRIPIAATAALAAAALASAAGCGGGGPDPAADERAVREAAQRVVDGTFLGGDPDAACAALAPEARARAAAQVPPGVLRATPTCALGMAFVSGFFDGLLGGDLRARVGAVTVAGDDARATIDYAGAFRERVGATTGTLRLRRVGGRWLVTGTPPEPGAAAGR